MRFILVFFALACQAFAQSVTVDPAGATLVPGLGVTITGDNAWTTAASAWNKTEWNTNGNLESWATSNTSATVSGGILSGTTTSADPQLRLTPITGGPDLDMGYNDFVEFRLQLPASYAGDIELFFGVANAYHVSGAAQTGFSTARSVTVPNASIPKDGSFHTYRIDMGLVQMWRGTLTDLRLDPATVSGTAFALDYLRIGDVPGNDYAKRVSQACPDAGEVRDIANASGVMKTHIIRSMESKRFRIIYSSVTFTEDPGAPWSDAKSRLTLRNMEENWQNHVKRLGYKDPTLAVGTTSGTRYKTNMTMIWLGGTWAGVDNDDPLFRGGYGWQNTYPAATRDNPPSWVNSHEFMHVCQYHQGGNFGGAAMGKWFEAHADYGEETALAAFPETFGTVSSLNDQYMSYRFLYATNPFSHYRVWPVFFYLDQNPDGFAPNSNPNVKLSARLWQESLPDEYIYATIDRLTKADGGTGVKDIIGGLARREAIFDYGDRKAPMQAAAASWNPDSKKLREYSALVRRADDPMWWQIPSEIAPQAFAYTIHDLVPTTLNTAGRVVSVNFRGLPNPARQADWRASLVVVDDSGNARYSSLWNDGVNSVTLAANENRVYLSVAATPGEINSPVFEDTNQSYKSDPAKTRFPYEVQLTGASVRETGGGSTSGLVQHANGGGWKASTATVASTAYLGPNARVLDTANVSGNARIEDFAVVKGSARIQENAIVSGHAVVRGNVIVRGLARIREYALVSSEDWQTGITIEGNVRVGGRRMIIDNFTAAENATLKGVGYAYQNYSARGDVIIDGDALGNANLNSGAHTGWLWDDQVPARAATMPVINRLIASYEFPAEHPHSAIDTYGVTDSPLVGSPAWVSSDGTRAGFLTFNGSGQRVLLSRWLNDFREFTVSSQVKWSGSGAANQPVFHFGDGTSAKQLYVTPSNAAGKCALYITAGGTTYTVAAASALPANAWAHVGITLDGTTAALYINGTLAGSAPCPVRPEDLLPGDTNETPARNFLASGTGLPDFQGALDDFKVHSTALSGLTGVGISPLATTLSEVGDPIMLTFTRNVLDASQLASALVVNYTVTGTATPGSDFTGLSASGSVTIPAGQSSVAVTLAPITDTATEGTESFTVNVAAGSNYGVTSGTATITMPDRVPLQNDLLAWYKFDETTGTTANDSSGIGNHATLVNDPVWLPSEKALSFDDANDDNDAVQTPVPNGGSRTLSAWFRPETSTWNQNIWNYNAVFDSDVPGGYGAGWGIVDSKIRVMLDDTMWDTGISITLNQWQHGSLTFDATTARFYLNGVLRGTFAYGQGGITTANYTIGSKAFDGQIRDAKIFGRQIYGIEAMEIYQAAAPSRAPRNLSAIGGHGNVSLAWQPADAGEISYTVRRATISGGPYTDIATGVTSTSFTDTNVANGTTYYYVVAAVSLGGTGPNSSQTSATPAAGTALPPPWVHANIGTAAGSPTTAFSGGQIAISGAGSTIGGSSTSDNFRIVYLPVIGDCTITARLQSLTGTPDVRAGVTLRESTATGSIHATAMLNQTASTTRGLFVYRASSISPNNSSAATILSAPPSQPWLRVVRSGNVFSAFYSTDGTSWTQIGANQTLPMSASGVYLAGFAVASSSTTALAAATFTNVTITGGYPTGLGATAGDAQVALSWNAVSGATSYRVKRSTTAGGPHTTLASPTSNNYIDTTAVNGTTYYYVVSAHNGTAESANSSQVFATPIAPLPSVPTGLVATDLGASVQLAWASSNNAAGYRVKRALSPDGPFSLIGSPTATTFTDPAAAPGTNFFYVVAAANASSQEGGDSQVASVVRVLHFDPNGTAAGSVSDGGSHAWLASNWAVAPGGTLGVGSWQTGKQAVFAATTPAAPLAYSVALTNYDTGSHGNFTGIRALGGTVTFTGNASNFYLTTPVAVTADPGAAIVFQQTRSGSDVLAFNLNNQPATFNGDVTVNSAGIGNGGSIIANSGTLKLGNAIANFSPGSITVQQGATLLNDGAAGKYFNLSQLTLNGGTLAATNAGDASRGNFVLTGGLVTGGTTTSVISADVRPNGGSDQTFNVADTPESVDLLLSGKLGHFNGIAWSYATKTGPGTMKISGLNEIGKLTVSEGKLILENTGIAGMGNGGLLNNSQVEMAVTGANVTFAQTIQGSGALTKTGPGTLSLYAGAGDNYANTYNQNLSGGLNISGGTMELTSQYIRMGSITIGNGGTLRATVPWATGASNPWFNGRSAGSITVNAGGTLISSTIANSILEGLTLNGGTVSATGGGSADWGNFVIASQVTAGGATTSTISAELAVTGTQIFDVGSGSILNISGLMHNRNGAAAGAVTKSGPGTMVLSAANSYTGATNVNAGTLLIHGSTAASSSVTVASTATLGGTGTIGGAITVNSGGTLAPGASIGTLTAASAAISGKLAIELDGSAADRLNTTGNLNITNATLALTGTPTAPELIIASFGSLTGSSFASVTGLPSGYQVTYDLTNKQIKLAAVSTGFAGWIGTAGVSNPAANADPDNDGIPNALEYVLGGNPSQSNSNIAPKVAISNGNLVFTFDRVDASETSDITLVVEAGSDLATWPEVFSVGATTATSSSGVDIQENAAAPDTISVTVPNIGAASKFARLRALVNP